MAEWIPFDVFEPVRGKHYFVTLKSEAHMVSLVTGDQLIGANNVLAVMEAQISAPEPYVPPKPKRRELWVSGGDNRMGLLVTSEKPETDSLGEAKLFREVDDSTIEIKVGEELFRFTSYTQWVNKASSWFANSRLREGRGYICVDAVGRICEIGKHFMRANREDTFPIIVYRTE